MDKISVLCIFFEIYLMVCFNTLVMHWPDIFTSLLIVCDKCNVCILLG